MLHLDRAVVKVEVLGQAGVDLVEDLVGVGALGRDHVWAVIIGSPAVICQACRS